MRSASTQKWLEMHGIEHWTEFCADYGVALKKQFFDHFLKGEDNGWDRKPPVLLNVRTLDGFVQREEHEWPMARTQWTRRYLAPASSALVSQPPAQASSVSYDAVGEGVTFSTEPLTEDTEITGPIAAKQSVSSSTADADLFLVVRVFGPEGDEVVFQGAIDPHTPIAQGWLRASHRKLGTALSEH